MCKPVAFRIGDPGDVLSLACALGQGYQIRQDGDGEAEVETPAGEVYHVSTWACDCPDAIGRKGGSYQRSTGERVCKHVVWISQLYPCPLCGGRMLLGEFRTALGRVVRRFECEVCGYVRDEGLVKAQRRADRYGVEAEAYCLEAIRWAAGYGADRPVWGALEQRPDVAPVMVRLLEAKGWDDLAAEVGKRYGEIQRV